MHEHSEQQQENAESIALNISLGCSTQPQNTLAAGPLHHAKGARLPFLFTLIPSPFQLPLSNLLRTTTATTTYLYPLQYRAKHEKAFSPSTDVLTLSPAEIWLSHSQHYRHPNRTPKQARSRLNKTRAVTKLTILRQGLPSSPTCFNGRRPRLKKKISTIRYPARRPHPLLGPATRRHQLSLPQA